MEDLMTNEETPIANPGDLDSDKTLYEFQFGVYADTKVYVWADNDEDAFEIAVEWADDHAKGVFTTITEADLKEAAEDEDIEWQDHWPDWDDPEFEKVVQAAEADLTAIGHTQLKSGTHIVSYEWHFHEVTDHDEIADVAVESFEEDGSDMLNIDYHKEGPDEDEPTSGLKVERNGGYIDITEWTDVYDATGEPESEGDILRQDARVDIYELLDPASKHRGTYSGDKQNALGDILLMNDREQEKAVVAAAISYLAYFGGEESHVSYIGE